MKIVMFGPPGGTGLRIVEQALEGRTYFDGLRGRLCQQ